MKLLATSAPHLAVRLLLPLLPLLLFFTTVHSSGPVHSCCLRTTDTILPLSKIQEYSRQTATLCPVDAIVFTTVKGVKICSSPTKPWVKRAMKNVDSKKRKEGKTAMPLQ